MIRKLLICFIFSGFSCLSFAQVKWLSFEKENCRIAYPPGWYEEPLSEELTGIGMKFMIMSPLDGKKDVFSENVNLAKEEKKAPITLQQFMSSSTSLLASVVDKFKLKSSTTKTNGSGEYGYIEYTGLLDNLKLQWMQCVWIKGIDIYVLSFTATQSAFKKYKPLFLTMADSFVIKSN